MTWIFKRFEFVDWNTTTWQQTNVLTGHTGSVNGIAISLSGILASASWDNTARLWKKENAKKASASSSRLPHSSIVTQSGGVAPTPSSPPHSASILFTTPSAASAATASGSPQPPQNSIPQHFGRSAQVQSASQLHAAVSIPSTTPAIATTSTTTLPGVMTRQAGWWPRF